MLPHQDVGRTVVQRPADLSVDARLFLKEARGVLRKRNVPPSDIAALVRLYRLELQPSRRPSRRCSAQVQRRPGGLQPHKAAASVCCGMSRIILQAAHARLHRQLSVPSRCRLKRLYWCCSVLMARRLLFPDSRGQEAAQAGISLINFLGGVPSAPFHSYGEALSPLIV